MLVRRAHASGVSLHRHIDTSHGRADRAIAAKCCRADNDTRADNDGGCADDRSASNDNSGVVGTRLVE